MLPKKCGMCGVLGGMHMSNAISKCTGFSWSLLQAAVEGGGEVFQRSLGSGAFFFFGFGC